MKKVLVIEDEIHIAEAVTYALDSEGFHPIHCFNLVEAVKILETNKIDIVVLDLGLPDGNGLDLLKSQSNKVPIIVLTAKNSELDRVLGLEFGADDYMCKPFSPRELTARVRAVLRRSSNPVVTSLKNRGFVVDVEGAQIVFHGHKMTLTKYEFLILKTLIDRPGRIFSRSQLLEKIWNSPDMIQERSVDAHIKSIRSKLREIDENVDFIVTHHGLGYSLKETE